MRFSPHLLLLVLLSTGCSATGGGPTGPESAAALLTAPEPQDSANDQRHGDLIVATMGDLKGKVVADLFAGDGYYTWKLLRAGARVLAIETDPAIIATLQARKQAEGIGDDRLIIRATVPGVTGLLPNEADMALITREYSTLGDRADWFRQMLSGVKPPGTFFLVNFFPVQTPFGPPLNQRMDYNTVSDELNEFGYTDIGVLYKRIPYRYILFASVVEDAERH